MAKGHGGGAKHSSSGPGPGRTAANNTSNQGNKTSPVYYPTRGLPVPPNLPSGPKPAGE